MTAANIDHLGPRIEHARDCLSRRVKLDGTTPLAPDLDLAAFEATMDNSFLEHVAYQNLQARSFAMGKLSLYDAQRIYTALGEAPGASGWAAETDLATKLVVTQALGELLGRKS